MNIKSKAKQKQININCLPKTEVYSTKFGQIVENKKLVKLKHIRYDMTILIAFRCFAKLYEALEIFYRMQTISVSVLLHKYTMRALGKIYPKIPRNVIFARISPFLVPIALRCIKEHMKIEKGR